MSFPLNETRRPEERGEQVRLSGQIERVTYFSEETGYTVAKVRLAGRFEPVTVVGHLIAPKPGETLEMEGLWMNHPKFGRQFKVSAHRTRIPVSAEGIKKYLESGFIKGIGPVMATRIVEKFGDKALDIIENRIEALEEIEGIGRKRVDMIQRAWQAQREIRDVMIFLQQHGVSTGYATKIFKRYGRRAIDLVSENPYRLATDVYGIGFSMADRIAQNLGFHQDTPARAQAGVLYVLDQLANEGHVYYPYQPLLEKCREILDVDEEIIVGAFGPLSLEDRIVVEDLNRDLDALTANQKAVYLKEFHVSETGVGRHMSRLISRQKGIREIKADDAVEWVQDKVKLTLASKQVEAVKMAITEKVMVITGGPGTGKTTIINAIIKIVRAVGARVLLAAPTGRASKRMSEATGYPAKTIHRLLAYSPHKGGFQKDEDHPLEADVIILDEVSMIDTVLMYHLLKAVPTRATLILVGDENQLPSVGAGSVLKDLIQSSAVPMVRLKEIFRQAQESLIIVNAHRINQGEMPTLEKDGNILQDFYFIEQEDPEQVVHIIQELVCHRIPSRFGLDPLEDLQVLSPMHKGVVGTDNLNKTLQSRLNPSSLEITRGERVLRLRDKVMQVRNNYEKEVFNGDIGQIISLDPEEQGIIVDFDGHRVPYEPAELDEIALAYAISVHKSQGSEYPAVIIPLLTQHYMLLQRNLIYTAVTRGKRLVVMVGTRKALSMGVRNDRIRGRYSFLAERLRGLSSQ